MSAALISKLDLWRAQPKVMVRELFGVIPDQWQDDVLDAFPYCPAMAMACCKGPGKTTVMAWCAWNFLLTRQYPKIGATSITGDNLRDNLWAEMSKWHARSPLLKREFEWNATRIVYKKSPQNWFMAARTWPKGGTEQEIGQTLAGFWSDNVMLLIDEAGGVPIAVLRTAEVIRQQFGTKGRDSHVIVAGNTTSTAGALYDAAINQRQSYRVFEVTADPDDPKRTPRIDIEYARKQIKEWGREDPWVMINILGRFPKQGLNTFISAEDVKDAQRRQVSEPMLRGWPRIMGVDVAEFGDDETVFAIRQNQACFPFLRMRGLDPIQVGAHAGRISGERKIQSIQVDATGLGSGTHAWLANAGYSHALAIRFGELAVDQNQFANKRAECWVKMINWVKEGGCLPPEPLIVKGLSSLTYTYNNRGQIQLERKRDFKDRIGRSPDMEDSLSCTFAFPVHVQPAAHPALQTVRDLIGSAQHDYDPFSRYQAEVDREQSDGASRDPR